MILFYINIHVLYITSIYILYSIDINSSKYEFYFNNAYYMYTSGGNKFEHFVVEQ